MPFLQKWPRLVLEISLAHLSLSGNTSHESHGALQKAAEGFLHSPQRMVCSREMGGLSQETILCAKSTLRANLEDTLYFYITVGIMQATELNSL